VDPWSARLLLDGACFDPSSEAKRATHRVGPGPPELAPPGAWCRDACGRDSGRVGRDVDRSGRRVRAHGGPGPTLCVVRRFRASPSPQSFDSRSSRPAGTGSARSLCKALNPHLACGGDRRACASCGACCATGAPYASFQRSQGRGLPHSMLIRLTRRSRLSDKCSASTSRSSIDGVCGRSSRA
jgi:hypothetical protein